jgi:predicted amidohydrolase
VTGINEKDPKYRGVMWNSSCVMDRKGQLVGRHRKLTPVLQELFYEKKGDIDDVRVFDLDVGAIGIGICAENWNPIYPSILGRLGEEIHCSLWMSPGANPNIASKPALSDLKEIVRHTAAAQAIQGTCFVICSVQVSSKKPDPAAASLIHYETGGSCIISPRGTVMVEAEDHKEQVVMADIDLAEIGIQKIEFDQFGKDARDDLFRIVLKSGPTPPTPIVDRSERYVHVSIPELQESTDIRNLREELKRAKEEIAKLSEELARQKRTS